MVSPEAGVAPSAPRGEPLPEAVRARFERIRARGRILDVRGLGVRYRAPQGEVEALRGIDFEVYRREFVCVIGPSGCGKSTLLRVLAGLEPPSAGAVLLDGQAVRGPGRDRGVVFQGYSLFPWLTVLKNVMFGLEAAGMGQNDCERNARLWLDLVGLGSFAQAYPHQLSGGMRQRVAIARALVNQPRILLMDEPFGALDAQTRARMQGHLLELWRNVDVTVIFITHDLDEAIYLADRILVLKAHPGEVQEILEVPLERPRVPAQFATREFRATRTRLEALIHPPAPAAEGEPVLRPVVIRMTDVGDSVD
jgi:NitT/TauT family transport system ATP-binding protein